MNHRIQHFSPGPGQTDVLFSPTFDSNPLIGVGNTPQDSWTAMQLAPFSPIGTGIQPDAGLNSLKPADLATYMWTPTGLPTVAGQIVHQPLFDPQTGYQIG